MGLSTAEWIAIGACVAAALAVLVSGLAWWKLRAVRTAQAVLLGGGKEDLVDFAVSLQGRIDDLHRAVDEIAAGLSRVDRRVDTAVSKTSLVRYDAYEGAGGHQSASIALLDAGRSGVVVSAIQGRDYARIYVKELDRGRPNVALSPEEEEAVERAMAGCGPFPQLHFGPDAAGSGSQRELRATERDNRSACPRARVQRQGRGDRGPRRKAPSP